jgi:hypothetical protein
MSTLSEELPSLRPERRDQQLPGLLDRLANWRATNPVQTLNFNGGRNSPSRP